MVKTLFSCRRLVFDHDERDINCLTAEFSNLLESNKIIYACKEGREWRRGDMKNKTLCLLHYNA